MTSSLLRFCVCTFHIVIGCCFDKYFLLLKSHLEPPKNGGGLVPWIGLRRAVLLGYGAVHADGAQVALHAAQEGCGAGCAVSHLAVRRVCLAVNEKK